MLLPLPTLTATKVDSNRAGLGLAGRAMDVPHRAAGMPDGGFGEKARTHPTGRDLSTSLFQWLWALIAGLGLGSLYFVGLWLTVQRMMQSRRGGLPCLMASSLLRLALVVLGLYLVAGHRWQDYLAALLGLLAARMYWTRRLGRRWPDLHDPQLR